MRALLAVGCLLSLLVVATGCTDPALTGECVTGIEYVDDPQIIPDPSPFFFCPVDPDAHNANGTPANTRLGSILLHNCGRLSIKISNSTLTNSGIEVFKNLQLASTEIAAGKEVALQFMYESKDLLAHDGTIKIESNAKNFPTLEIALHVVANGSVDGGVCPLITPATDGGTEDH